MLGSRIVTALILIAVFSGVMAIDEWWNPWYPCWFFIVAATVIAAARELVGLMQLTAARPSQGTVLGGCLAIVVANWIPHLLIALSDRRVAPLLAVEAPAQALVWPLWAFVAVVMVSFIGASVQFERPGGTIPFISGTVLAVAYIGLLGSFLIQHRWLVDPSHGWVPLVLLIATCKGSDIGAYTLGRLAGRHKLWPRLSPNKTIEGALGGLLFAVVAALVTAAIARHFLHFHALGPLETAGYGLIVGTVAQLGDLMESLIKRDVARKDASDALPGFGGVLDVVDSILFAGPVSYAYWLLFGM